MRLETEFLPGSILAVKSLSLSCKRVWSQIAYMQGRSRSVRIDQAWLASKLSLSREAVTKAVRRLRSERLLRVTPAGRVNQYSVIHPPHTPKKFFLFYSTYDSGYKESTVLVLAYLKARQGKNDRAWPHLATISEDLGLSKATVCRCIRELEEAGELHVKRANGGRLQGNKYKVRPVTVCGARLESRVSNVHTNNNTQEDLKKSLGNPISKSPRLSTPEHSGKVRMLSGQGVRPIVAEGLARQHDTETVKSACKNAVCQAKRARERGKSFTVPGYIVATLNQAKSEGHGVRLNTFAARLEASADFKQNQLEAWKNLSSSERDARDAANRARLRAQIELLKKGA